jgi:hypothetical protein
MRRRHLRAPLRAACCLAAGIALASCSDATAAKPLVIPAFVVVGDSAGFAKLYRVEDSVVTPLATPLGNDTDPRSAAGRIVFTSDRDGNAEVYIADIAMSQSRRVTRSSAADNHPALDPGGSTIAFVSNRSGTPRLWIVPAPAFDDTTFDAPVALETGSATSTPEDAPAWSPDGATITFSSTRTGRSQIFTVPATGGSAVQLTNDVAGAYTPQWSADGATIYFISAAGTLHLRRVKASGGAAADFPTDSLDLDAPSCNADACLTAENPAGGRGSILAFPVQGGKATVVMPRTRNERQAAIIVP